MITAIFAALVFRPWGGGEAGVVAEGMVLVKESGLGVWVWSFV